MALEQLKDTTTNQLITLSREVSGITQTTALYDGVFGKASKENKGKHFPFIALSESNWDNDLAFIGKQFVSTKISKVLRALFGTFYVESWDETKGELDQAKWLELAQEFDQGQDKKDELLAEKDALSDQFALITDVEDFEKIPGNLDKIKTLGEQITAINEKIKAIQVDIDAKTAKRNATKKANAEKAAADNAASMAKKQAGDNVA